MSSPYRECLAYIENHWDKLTFSLPQDSGTRIGLPNPFVSPTAERGRYAYDQFYWDSYFIILGLIASGRVGLAKGMVDNFAYLYRRFGIIPMRNHYYTLGISQPPFLTSMAREVFEQTGDTEWLLDIAEVAEQELQNYWLGHEHRAHKGLSRYWDHYILHETAEFESGWDRTSRFQDQCLDFLPVDLNSLLYKYEADLAQIFALAGDTKKKQRYQRAADARRRAMAKLTQDPVDGFFFDYNYKKDMRSSFYSLAGFFPLWAGLVTGEEAIRAHGALRHFEHAGGLANTQMSLLLEPFRQWDYPNGWPCLQWITIKGLLNYGFRSDAERLAKRWLDLNVRIFNDTGKLWEKYNTVGYTVGISGRYPIEHGFGWTNAVFLKLCKEFGWD
jgi:alpha,alpha-trehalase